MRGSAASEAPPMEAWGIEARLERLAGGARNAVLRTVGLQRDLVFKTTRRTAAQILWLLPVQDCARRAGFVVPGCIGSITGDMIVDGWTCEEFVAGRPAASGDVPRIGRLLRAMHPLSAGMPQRPGFKAARDLISASQGGDIDFGGMPDAVVAACRDAFRPTASSGVAGIHGDVNLSNAVITDDGQVALLDWDEARVDAPVFDTGPLLRRKERGPETARLMLAWEVAVCWHVEPERARRLANELCGQV